MNFLLKFYFILYYCIFKVEFGRVFNHKFNGIIVLRCGICDKSVVNSTHDPAAAVSKKTRADVFSEITHILTLDRYRED